MGQTLGTLQEKEMRKVLARYPNPSVEPTLWLFPREGVFLTHRDSVTAIRICSFEQYQTNFQVLIDEGWILENQS
jgi:hypothetical protein